MNKEFYITALAIMLLIIFGILLDVAEAKPIQGDINADGYVDETDLDLCRGHILRRFQLSGPEYLRADMNDDGRIDSTDLAKIRLIILGRG